MKREDNWSPTIRDILQQYCRTSEECVESICDAVTLHKVKRHDVIVRQGEISDFIVINRNGIFRIGLRVNEKEDTILFGTSGDVFLSMQTYLSGAPAIFSLEALVDAEIWKLSINKMKNLSLQYPELVVWSRNLFADQLGELERRYVFLNFRTAHERLELFHQMLKDSRHSEALRNIMRSVPLKYIAQYLKITPQTLSKLRREMLIQEREANSMTPKV